MSAKFVYLLSLAALSSASPGFSLGPQSFSLPPSPQRVRLNPRLRLVPCQKRQSPNLGLIDMTGARTFPTAPFDFFILAIAAHFIATRFVYTFSSRHMLCKQVAIP